MFGKNSAQNSRGIKTAQNRTAAIMVLAGIGALGLFIAALAGGFEGWAWIAAAATVVLIAGGVLLIRAAARRKEVTNVVYRPDSTVDAYDVDRATGKRTPHRD